MDTILSNNDNKKTICLNYLGISARKLLAATSLDEKVAAMRTLKHYLELAYQYGCSDKEMRFALGWSRERYNSMRGVK